MRYHLSFALALTHQQMKTNTWIKPQHTWARYRFVYTEFNLWKHTYFGLARAFPAIPRFTSAQRRLSRTVSRGSIVSFGAVWRLTQQTCRYGQEVKIAPQYSSRVTYLDGKTPLATFIFKYRDFSVYIYPFNTRLRSIRFQVSCKLMA